MFNLPLLKKNIAPMIRREIQDVELRYVRVCELVDDMISRDLSVKEKDMAQKKYDLKKFLLNEIYQPYKDELLQFLAVVNRFHDEEKKYSEPAKEIKKQFEILWRDMMLDYDKSKWENKDWKTWRQQWYHFMVLGMNSALNSPDKE